MSRNADLIANLADPFGPTQPTIRSLVSGAIAARSDATKELDIQLPDKSAQEGDIRFVGGALDALFGAPDRSHKQVEARTVVSLVRKAVRRPSVGSLSALYRKLDESSATSIIDEVLARLPDELKDHREAVAALGRRLACDASDVEPVKFGIALLGIAGDKTDEATLLELGQADEFTLFATVALINLGDGSERSVWKLAKSVHGWGRVTAVDRLSKTEDPEIKSWLVREGFRNMIMDEYLAYTCARAGELHVMLAAEEIDDELLSGAAGIIVALIRGGPAEDIFDYAEAPEACLTLIGHALTRDRPSLDVVESVVDVQRLVTGDQVERLKQSPGWSPQVILELRANTNTFLKRPGAIAAVEEGMKSREQWGTPYLAASLASHFGIDSWPWYLDRQRQKLGENWFYLMQTDQPARIEQVLELARAQLDLQLVGSGPSNSLGLGEEYRSDSALDFIVQELRKFPGMGWDLLKIALKGRTVRLRNMAINALRDWGRSNWPSDAEAIVQETIGRETDDDVRKRFERLLAGDLER